MRLLLVLFCLLQFPVVASSKKTKKGHRKPSAVSPAATGLSIHPVDDQGEFVKTVRIPEEETAEKDLLFKYLIPDSLNAYTSWGFEVADPSRHLRYRSVTEGKVPLLIHWDGMFNSDMGIQVNQKYFVRLILVFPEKKVVASPWSFFSTRAKIVFQGTRIGKNFIDLYVQPVVGTYAVLLRTKDYKSYELPIVYGDLRLIYKNKHTLGLKFECSSNILFGYEQQISTGYAFSDFSLMYRYRLLGTPLRPPEVDFLPPYLYENSRAAPPSARAFGEPTNMEIGFRMFYTTLRGFEGTPLDSELAHQAQGLAAVFDMNQSLWVFRLHTLAEAGYSLFRGNFLLWSLESALTYDRLESFSPGLQLRYVNLTGQPASDQSNSGTQVQNSIIFAGGIIYFKL